MDGLAFVWGDGDDEGVERDSDDGDRRLKTDDFAMSQEMDSIVSNVDKVEAIDDATWDDVLNAFDAYCREEGDERTPPRSQGKGASKHALATRAVMAHMSIVLRDIFADKGARDGANDSAIEDDGASARETKRREAEDPAKTMTYVRYRVNAYVRKHKSTIDKRKLNRLTILRDMFVAEFRTFDERARDIERRTAAAAIKTTGGNHHLCLNLPDAGEVMRRRFKAARVKLLDAFDSSFDHVTKSTKCSIPASTTSSASTATKAKSPIEISSASKSENSGKHDKNARKILSAWLWDHFYPTDTRLKPIPTREEKEDLARQTGLTPTQVGDWFVNARARLWKPYIEGLIRGTYNDAMVKKALELQAEAA